MTAQEDRARTLLRDRVRGALLGRVAGIPARPDPEAPAPLSAAQSRIWFAWRYEPDTPLYLVSVTLRLRGPLDEPAMLGAVRDLAERHRVLRRVITEHDGVPVAVAVPADAVPVSTVDIMPADLAGALRERRSQPFALDAEPPVRGVLYRLGPDHHVLALTFHHIAFDGWSHPLAVAELAALYTARRGAGAEPDPPRLQYADFAEWERRQPESPDLEWWCRRLAGLPPVLDLPSDRRRPPVAGTAAAEIPVLVPEPVAGRLRRLAGELGCTDFMILLAAWQVLLSRLSGVDDIVVGVPAAGRGHRDTEDIVGCFVNTLAVRTELPGDLTGRQLISLVRDRVLDVFDHANVPFERVVERLNPRRSTAAAPVVQVLFNLLDARGPSAGFTGLEVEEHPEPYQALEFDLSLDLRAVADGYSGVLAYRTDLLDAESVARWARWYPALVELLAAEPDRQLSTLDMVDPGERASVLAAGQGAPLPDEPPSVPRAVLDQASRTPGAIAVVDREGTLSYAELADLSGRVARAILAEGPTGLVGVSLPADRFLPAVLLGVWRAGAGYVPLEPNLPADRMAWIARDAGVGLLLTRGGAPVPGLRTLDVSDPPPGAALGSDVDGSALAYVLYTSGSTGRPKGVEVTQAALAERVAGIRRWPGVWDRDAVLALAPLSFDALGGELWPALTTGGRCVMVDRDLARDGNALAEWIAASRPTVMQPTPTTLRMLLAAGWSGDPSLRVWSTGEQLDAALARELTGRVGELWNVYGPTESLMFVTAYRVPESVGGDGVIPIGGPLSGVRSYVIDRHGQLALPGVVGELWLGGTGLARGYRDRPDLTERSFAPNPFQPGERCYRTGDLVRRRSDNELEFLGRRDHQVKVRGYRIELGEVEAAILDHAEVTQATTVVVGTGPEAHLAGYLAPSTVDTQAIEASLRRRLPAYMVPRRWMALDALPVQPSGKVDRAALPALEPGRDTAFVDPDTEAELLVSEVWRAVLGVERVSAADDFFALGGHSFAATRVAGRLSAALDLPVPVRLLFDRPVLAELATELERLLLAGLDR